MDMSVTHVTDCVQSLGRDFEYFKQLNDARLAEIEKKGSADPLYMDHLQKLGSAIDNTKSRMDAMETALSRPAADTSSYRNAVVSGYESEYKQAFNNYLRKGLDAGLEHLQTKALSVGSDSDGGYLVTPTLSDRVITIIRESSPMRALATVETISTDSLDIIEDRDEAATGWTTETTAVTETNSPNIGKRSIPVFEIFAQPKATQKLVDDSAVDIESWISNKVADVFSRRESTAFVTGNGVSQPRGFLTYAAGTSWGQVEQVNSGTSAVVTADSLIRLYYSLKEAYAKQANFLINRSVVQSIRLLKDTTNQYIWQPGLAAGAPDTLMGVPVKLASDMPVAAANSLSVAVGDFKSAYVIVDRIAIRILRDPFTEKPFVKFYTTKRVGGDVTNFEAIKLLKLS
jgi:HK97 family phage major capsid protein